MTVLVCACMSLPEGLLDSMINSDDDITMDDEESSVGTI